MLNPDKISEHFEDLSGSVQFSQDYKQCQDKTKRIEAEMADISEKLKVGRQEKIKRKGLTDYQK
jgi:hypothetical protein